MGMAGRMIRRAENTRFVGRVHETFNEVFAPNKQFNCFTHHYGYAFENLEAAKKLGVKPMNCLVFEDIPKGITAGKEAGMRVCAVEDLYSAHQREVKIQMSDYYIEDYYGLFE